MGDPEKEARRAEKRARKTQKAARQGAEKESQRTRASDDHNRTDNPSKKKSKSKRARAASPPEIDLPPQAPVVWTSTAPGADNNTNHLRDDLPRTPYAYGTAEMSILMPGPLQGTEIVP